MTLNLLVVGREGGSASLATGLAPLGAVIPVASVDAARRVLAREIVHLVVLEAQRGRPADSEFIRLCERLRPSTPSLAFVSAPGPFRVAFSHFAPDALLFASDSPAQIRSEVERVLHSRFAFLPRRRIAVLTSGGDSPGMNAALHALVRTAIAAEVEVLGVLDGYRGLVNGHFQRLDWHSFDEEATTSGTALGSSRFSEFHRPDVRKLAVERLLEHQVSGLVVLGGDGSMQGVEALARDATEAGLGLQTLGLPATIDNDLQGTETTLGAASAVASAMRAMLSLRGPARAVRRIFVVEIMGRQAGYLALVSGVSVMADGILLPEAVLKCRSGEAGTNWQERIDPRATAQALLDELNKLSEALRARFASGKRDAIVVVSEGLRLLSAGRLGVEYIQQVLERRVGAWPENIRPDVRTQVLGHVVRGADPCPDDVILGSLLGAAAVDALLAGRSGLMLGWSAKAGILETPISEVAARSRQPPAEVWRERPQWARLSALHRSMAEPPAWWGKHDGLLRVG